MNKVVLIGRLTRDPELRYTGSNTPVATFSLAVNRNFSNQNGEREADFINIVVWRKQAENVKNYLTQGSQVAIDGRIQTRSYDDQDGKKRYVTEVVADNVEFLGSKSSNKGSNEMMDNPFQVENEVDLKTTDVKDDPFKDFGDEIKISDDDLPF
jgi:single-strand DNA-binding protein